MFQKHNILFAQKSNEWVKKRCACEHRVCAIAAELCTAGWTATAVPSNFSLSVHRRSNYKSWSVQEMRTCRCEIESLASFGVCVWYKITKMLWKHCQSIIQAIVCLANLKAIRSSIRLGFSFAASAWKMLLFSIKEIFPNIYLYKSFIIIGLHRFLNNNHFTWKWSRKMPIKIKTKATPSRSTETPKKIPWKHKRMAALLFINFLYVCRFCQTTFDADESQWLRYASIDRFFSTGKKK